MTAIRIAARMRRIKPSPSSAATDRLAQLRRDGRDIVSLLVGEPDFDTPAHIRQAAIAAIEGGQTRYTQTSGMLALRQAIAAKLERENGLTYDPREIIVTVGAKHAIFNALSVTVEPGDEVLIPAPFWVSYPDMVLACNGMPVVVACKAADGFLLTAAALESALTPATRWLVLNSPSNPTGAAYSESQLRSLADVLLRHPQVMILTDDIYEHIRFSGSNTHLVAVEPRLKPRTAVVNGVSKTYAMTGWRIGFAAGPSALIEAMDTLQSQSTSCAASISQAAALAALTSDAPFLPEWVATYQSRRDRALQLVKRIPGLSCDTLPEGAFYLFINCAGLIGKQTPEGKPLESDLDVALFLLESAGVAMIGGTSFGLSPYLRISIATGVEVIEEAFRRIAGAVERLT